MSPHTAAQPSDKVFCGQFISPQENLMTTHRNSKRPFIQNLVAPVLTPLCLALMLLLSRVWPLAHVFPLPANLFGLIPLVIGMAISLSAKQQFDKLGANFHPFEDPADLVTGGLFRYSRNPMYLGITIFLSGTWVLLGALSPLVIAGGFFLVADRWYIANEERRLRHVFGQAYEDYQARTGRWISLPGAAHEKARWTRLNRGLDVVIGILTVMATLSIVGADDTVLGYSVHTVSGILLAIGCAAHLALHWRWINAVVLHPSKSLCPKARRDRRVALWLTGLLLICSVTGLASLAPESARAVMVDRMHGISGIAFLGLAGYHLALHGKRSATRSTIAAHSDAQNVNM
jgi:protein-S-isoprenylcysteine O-methyltransferase Ste14